MQAAHRPCALFVVSKRDMKVLHKELPHMFEAVTMVTGGGTIERIDYIVLANVLMIRELLDAVFDTAHDTSPFFPTADSNCIKEIIMGGGKNIVSIDHFKSIIKRESVEEHVLYEVHCCHISTIYQRFLPKYAVQNNA